MVVSESDNGLHWLADAVSSWQKAEISATCACIINAADTSPLRIEINYKLKFNFLHESGEHTIDDHFV